MVTPGWWDLRPTSAALPWPDLSGARCLDVGTMDGFWAFEMERRGAADVVAIDLADPTRQDAPFARPAGGGHRRGEAFRVAAGLRRSRAEWRDLSVHDLDPAVHGTFDVVMCGYVLQAVRDPLAALWAMRRVCRGWVIVLDTVSAPLSLLPVPLARLDARRGALEWFVFNRPGLARAVSLAGFRVEARTRLLRDRPGPAVVAGTLSPSTRVRHALGLLGRSAAVRGRVEGASSPP